MKHEKIAPSLLAALDDFRRTGDEGLEPHRRSLGIFPSKGPAKPSRAIVFLHCEDDVSLSGLAQLGIHVNQEKGRVRTASVPLGSIDACSDDPLIKRIVPSHRLKPLMDDATKAVQLPAFVNRTNLTGKDVVVGIVDSGIDSTHAAFSGRIKCLWDQTLNGTGVPEGPYGTELTGIQLASSIDTQGHGTHVAGIAGGRDPKYAGIAIDADYVIVKTDFQDAHIADGIRYIFRVADGLRRPAVVNLSLGGHYDAHDGTDSLSQVIDGATGPGKIICCAAGNEGDNNIHAQTNVLPNAVTSMRFQVPNNGIYKAILNGWYPGSASLEIAVRAPNNLQTPYQPVVSSGNPARTYSLGYAQVQIITQGPNPENNDHQILVVLTDKRYGQQAPGGIWQLIIRNPGKVGTLLDVWALSDDGGTDVIFTGTSVQNSMKIGSPGCALSTVTVGSYTTKTKWVDSRSHQRSVPFVLNDISPFSSPGPLRNGQKKPDLAAPGAMIISCLSSNSNPDTEFVINQSLRVDAGTSMATPFVTGLIALLLERDPKLDPPGVKNMIKSGCTIPTRPAAAFDSKWGYGIVDAGKL